MGAKLSLEKHDPERIKTLRNAEDVWLKTCNCSDVAKEEWVDVSSHEKELKGIRKIRTFQFGSSDKNDPLILFVHGGGGVALEFADLFTYLDSINKEDKNTTNYRFWFMERPGHGVSDAYDYYTVSDSLDAHAAALLEALRDAAGVEKVHLVGNSAGGWYTYQFAKHSPDRVASFSWVGTPAAFKGQSWPFKFYVLGTWLGTQIMSQAPPKAVAQDLVFGFHKQDPDKIPDSYIDMYLAFMSVRDNSLSWNYWMRIMVWQRKKYDLVLETLKESFAGGTKCLFIVGENDIGNLINEDQVKAIEEQFDRETVIIPGAGHLPWHEDQEKVANELFHLWKT